MCLHSQVDLTFGCQHCIYMIDLFLKCIRLLGMQAILARLLALNLAL